MLHGRPAVIEDIYSDPRIPKDAYRPTFVKSLAMVAVGTDPAIAAIGNYWAKRYLPSAEEVALLQALADLVAVTLEDGALLSDLCARIMRD
jgi:two-component system CheB/CheR fusion protein